MAVTTSVFTTVPNQVWLTNDNILDIQETDPIYKVNVQLTNFINGVNNPNWIRHRDDARPIRYLFKSNNLNFFWDLVMNEGETTPYGMHFMGRTAGAQAASSYTQYMITGTSGTDNWTIDSSTDQITSYTNYWDMRNPGIHFIAYEPTGINPWFVYAFKPNIYTTTQYFAALFRLDTSGLKPGSYYPESGLGKWIVMQHTDRSYRVPQLRYQYPYYGHKSVGYLSWFLPQETGYFFTSIGQWGNTHYFGTITDDLIRSNDLTGSWGDTVTINSIDYTCIALQSFSLWVKTTP